MVSWRSVLFCATIFSTIALSVIAQSEAPELYIDKGVCPYEGCSYGEWRVTAAVVVREAKDTFSSVVCVLHAGDIVMAIEGEVDTRPGVARVLKDRKSFKKGEHFLLYTYMGEGIIKVWHGGEMTETETFGFCNADCINGIVCHKWNPDDPDCWAIVERNQESLWWVRIRSMEGLEGWCLNDTISFCKSHAYDKNPP